EPGSSEPRSLVTEEEEGPVASVIVFGDVNRPAHCTPEFIPVCHIAHLRKRIAGIVVLIAIKSEQIPVQLVGATLGHDVDDSAGVAAVAGAVVVRLDTEFLERVRERKWNIPVQILIEESGAVEHVS